MIQILPDNPYRDQLLASQARTRTKVVTGTAKMSNGEVQDMALYKAIEPVTFSRVYQYKTLLAELSGPACRIFMHIVLTLGYEEQKVFVKRKDIGLSEKTFSRSMLELITNQVISPVAHKRELYWVNLGIICVGRIARAEHQSPPSTK